MVFKELSQNDNTTLLVMLLELRNKNEADKPDNTK